MNSLRSVTRSKQQAKISYDKLSKCYDFFIGGMERRFRDAGLQAINVQEGERVLEVGFGTGYCTSALAKAVGTTGRVHGIDLSEGMRNATTERLAKEGLSERVELYCGDAASLPYANNSFDAVFISFALELFDTPDIPVVLQQFRRVLKDNGRLCVVAMSKEGKTGLMVRLYEWSHEHFPNYIDCRPIFVRHAMETARFRITNITTMSLLNVPVTIALGYK